MQNKWHEHSVGNIVVNFPLSSAIFRAAGIDYCCGGGRLLGEVIKEQRLVEQAELHSGGLFIKRWMSLPPVRKSPLSLSPK